VTQALFLSQLTFVLVLSIFVLGAPFSFAADVPALNVKGLPEDALIIETQRLPETSHANRVLVLWMEHPLRNARHEENGVNYNATGDDEPYTCPEVTRGSFYRGPTRVSLVDSRSGSIINTVRIVIELKNWDEDSFDIPYWIQPKYYRVMPPLRTGEGIPKIIDLHDFNGDGRSLEFVLYDAESCSSVNTQLIGYSIKTDRVIRYPIRASGKWLADLPSTVHWLSNWLTRIPAHPGYWHYREEYNSGATCVYDIRYATGREQFVGFFECN